MHKFVIALLITGGVQAAPVAPSGTTTVGADPAAVDDDTPSSPIVEDANRHEVELVGEAVRRFTERGFRLPPVEITFSDTRDACDGFRGLYRPAAASADDPVDRIMICDESPVHLYHELGHAWEHHAVADGTRDELLNRWQLNTWSDRSEDWDARGVEHAAKAISYALAFDLLPVGLNVSRYVCEFEFLTGTPLPAEIPYPCDADVDAVATPSAAETGSWSEKNPADDPRQNPIAVAGSSGTDVEAPWSWEHEGPGSHSLVATSPTPRTGAATVATDTSNLARQRQHM